MTPPPDLMAHLDAVAVLCETLGPFRAIWFSCERASLLVLEKTRLCGAERARQEGRSWCMEVFSRFSSITA